jgi:hypothetical protein
MDIMEKKKHESRRQTNKAGKTSGILRKRREEPGGPRSEYCSRMSLDERREPLPGINPDKLFQMKSRKDLPTV